MICAWQMKSATDAAASRSTPGQQESLLIAEERIRLILDSAAEGILGVDASGKMTFVNPAALQMLGYSKDELVGQVLHDLVHHSYPDGAPYPREACPMYESYALGKANRVTTKSCGERQHEFPCGIFKHSCSKGRICCGRGGHLHRYH